MFGPLPITQSFKNQTAEITGNVLFKVPEDADENYLVTLCVVDRGGTLVGDSFESANTGAEVICGSVALLAHGKPFAVGAFHAFAGDTVTLATSLADGTVDYDVYVSFIRL